MTLRKDILLSVVAPCYNEEAGIGEYIARTLEVVRRGYENFEIVLVDDGSKDRTATSIAELQRQYPQIRLIRLSRNYGREIAMTAGLENAIGDYVVLMDSDLQDPPTLIPELVDKLEQGYDMVVAKRMRRLEESWFKKFSSRLFYRLATHMTGFDIPKNVGDYRVMSRKVVNAIVHMKETTRYMKLIYAYVGFRSAEVSFERQARFTGRTKYNYAKLFNAALDAIISFSNKPLRYISIASIGMALLAFLISSYVIMGKLISGDQIAAGWTSLFVMVSFFFAVLFVFLAVISEYISRILVESTKRPLYYIAEETNTARTGMPASAHSIKRLNIADDV